MKRRWPEFQITLGNAAVYVGYMGHIDGYGVEVVWGRRENPREWETRYEHYAGWCIGRLALEDGLVSRFYRLYPYYDPMTREFNSAAWTGRPDYTRINWPLGWRH